MDRIPDGFSCNREGLAALVIDLDVFLVSNVADAWFFVWILFFVFFSNGPCNAYFIDVASRKPSKFFLSLL